MWEKREDIEKEIVHYFQHLYKGEQRFRPTMDGITFKKLSLSQASSLEERFSKEEIRIAVFGLAGDRAPGPDGYPKIFFQHFWDLLEDDLVVFFNEFHSNGVITRELGASFIALIPKKHGAISIKDFLPISLIGSLYKIVAKVLANRLRKVLSYIISDIQGAFVDGCQILDSVLVAHECLDSRNRQKRPGLVCKLDFEKAYDMVDWGFLRYMMSRLGFGHKWCQWINSCVSSAYFSVSVNGSPKGYF